MIVAACQQARLDRPVQGLGTCATWHSCQSRRLLLPVLQLQTNGCDQTANTAEDQICGHWCWRLAACGCPCWLWQCAVDDSDLDRSHQDAGMLTVCIPRHNQDYTCCHDHRTKFCLALAHRNCFVVPKTSCSSCDQLVCSLHH